MTKDTQHRRLLDLVGAMFDSDSRERLIAHAPLLYVLRTTDTVICRCHADLPDDMAAALKGVAGRRRGRPRDCAKDYGDYIGILSAFGALQSIRFGPLYGFPDFAEREAGCVAIDTANADLLRGGLDDWAPDVALGLPMIAAVADGRAVSICASVRASERAHCAGVETLPDYRGRGFGARTVAAWARAVQATGATPFYATTFDNLASLGLARRLVLPLIGSEFSVA